MTISATLMTSGELAARLHDEEVAVYDCRFAGHPAESRARYLDGHVPGAIHVYWLEDLSAADTTVTTFLPQPDQAAERLGRLGIGHDKLVVAYSDGGNLYASRLWHVLAHYGHKQIALLDGGIEKWHAEGRPFESGPVAPSPTRFEPGKSSRLGIDAAEILKRLDDPRVRLVDVRGQAEFAGEERRAARGGHIPGAIPWPWEENLRPDGTFHAPAAIRARAEAAGLSRGQELITYCQGGVRAAHAAFALRMAGYRRLRIYDGSWAEWGNEPSLPIETGAAAVVAA